MDFENSYKYVLYLLYIYFFFDYYDIRRANATFFLPIIFFVKEEEKKKGERCIVFSSDGVRQGERERAKK